MQNKEEASFGETGFFIRANDETLDLTPYTSQTLNIKKSLSVVSSVPYGPTIHSERVNSTTGDFFNYILNVGVAGGKWYYEANINCDTEIIIGWDTLDAIPRSSLVEGVGTSKYSYGYQVDAGFLQHEGLVLQQYKVLQKGDTFGVSIDMDTNTIIFYQNGKKIVGSKIRENSKGPFYPAVSMEAGSKIEWLIQSTDFKHPIPNYKGLGDDLDLSKVSLIHYTNANSPPPDSLEFQRAFLYRFEQNFGPVISEKIQTSTVASFVAHLAQKISPELKGEVLSPQDLEQLRMMLAGQLKEQIMSRVIRIYELYFAESISKWKETTLEPSMYPLLSSLRSRTSELTNLESDMKYYIIFHAFAEKLASENPDGPPPQTPPLFDYVQEQLEEKLTGFDATKVALYNILDASSVKAMPYEYSKIDINSLQKWRKGLAAKGSTQLKTILEILEYVDLPIADFIEKPLNLSVSALSNHLDSYLTRLLMEYNKLVESYKSNVSQEKAVSFYQQLRKGVEERKGVLSDPLNLPLVLFISGTLAERTKKFGEFLYEAYNLKNFKLKSSSKPTSNTSESSTPNTTTTTTIITTTTTTTSAATPISPTVSSQTPTEFKIDPISPRLDVDPEEENQPKKPKRKPKKKKEESSDALTHYLLFGVVAVVLIVGGGYLYKQYYKDRNDNQS